MPGRRYAYAIVDSVQSASQSMSRNRPLLPGGLGPRPYRGSFKVRSICMCTVTASALLQSVHLPVIPPSPFAHPSAAYPQQQAWRQVYCHPCIYALNNCTVSFLQTPGRAAPLDKQFPMNIALLGACPLRLWRLYSLTVPTAYQHSPEYQRMRVHRVCKPPLLLSVHMQCCLLAHLCMQATLARRTTQARRSPTSCVDGD